VSGLGPAPAELLAGGTPDLLRIRSGRGRALVAGFSLAHFMQHVVTTLLNPLLPLIRDSFALSYAESGFVVTAYSVSLGLANAPMGILADRIGSRAVLAAGLVLVGVAAVALAVAAQYWQVLLLLVGMGLVSATYHAPAVSILSRAFPASTRGAAMGIHTAGGSLAVFAAPLVAAFFASSMSPNDAWRAAYLWTAAIPIVCGIAVWIVAPSGMRAAPVGRGWLAATREVLDAFGSAGSAVALSIAFQVVYAATLAFLALYLVDARGLAPAAAAAIFAVPQAAAVVGPLVGGPLSDRMGRRAVIAIGLALFGPAMWIFTATPTVLVAAPLAVMGLTAGMRTNVTEVLVAESAPPARRATVLGTYYLLAAHIGGIAAPILGAFAGAIGIGPTFAWVGALLTALSALTVGLALARRL
jgi:MFS transporter, FSR family, fosmidomycin resistance protein